MLFLAVFLAAASPTSTVSNAGSTLGEARHALEVGRLDQAAMMMTAASNSGVKGGAFDRLSADLAFARREWARAIPIYVRLSNANPTDAVLAEHAGISSLENGDAVVAKVMLDRATALFAATWRAWDARGALADRQRDWGAADAAYAKALALAPNSAEVANNRGWSLLLRGRWRDAEADLSRAAELAPENSRIGNNSELARASLATHLPQRRTGEDDDAWAARLNDAGVVAAMRGDRPRAIAAFAQSIELRASWDPRAAANLSAIESTR